MKVSVRSWALLLCSTMTPITVASFRLASLDQRRAIARATEHVFGLINGLVPMFTFFGGILCFIAFLVSIVFDYIHSRKHRWPT